MNDTAHRTVRTDRSGGVLTLVMDRAEKKNALTNEMYGFLADALEAAQDDPAVCVVVIRGARGTCSPPATTSANSPRAHRTAGRATCADSSARSRSSPSRCSPPCRAGPSAWGRRCCSTATTSPSPRTRSSRRRSSAWAWSRRPPRACSCRRGSATYLRAFSMLALGETVRGDVAMDWGLATTAVPAAELVPTIEAAAARIAQLPLGAVRATKQLMRDATAITEHMGVEGEEFAARLTSPEAEEAFATFAEKRKPDFTQLS